MDFLNSGEIVIVGIKIHHLFVQRGVMVRSVVYL